MNNGILSSAVAGWVMRNRPEGFVFGIEYPEVHPDIVEMAKHGQIVAYPKSICSEQVTESFDASLATIRHAEPGIVRLPVPTWIADCDSSDAVGQWMTEDEAHEAHSQFVAQLQDFFS
ncbi:MAG: hypothetical protein K0S20_594 [Patescibacteria group bacterium]|nr:hypothetical protein [Patescibacteria group bacterium]